MSVPTLMQKNKHLITRRTKVFIGIVLGGTVPIDIVLTLFKGIIIGGDAIISDTQE